LPTQHTIAVETNQIAKKQFYNHKRHASNTILNYQHVQLHVATLPDPAATRLWKLQG